MNSINVLILSESGAILNTSTIVKKAKEGENGSKGKNEATRPRNGSS